jgi:hypothetical protein
MILPADLSPRAFLGTDSLSYSEAATLASCEMKHFYSYQCEREEQTKSAALARGTEMHRLTQHWALTGEILPSEDETSAWLMDRYARHYAGTRDQIKMLAVEIPFAMKLDAPWDGHVFGFWDGLAEVSGVVINDDPKDGLWLDEKKTMADWRRLGQLPVDLQVSLYIARARQAGHPVRGVIFDAMRTQRWVRGPERPLVESFERVWIERSQEKLDDALEQMYSALALRDGLTGRRPRKPLRNVGQACDWCFFKTQCYGLTVELVDESDDQ